MAKASVLTVGCRLNQAESDVIRNILAEEGYEFNEEISRLDMCIINTCTVTKGADRTSINLIRRMTKLSPKPRVVVTGCLVAGNPLKIEKIAGIDEVIDIGKKAQLIHEKGVLTMRSRPFLKIEDGCNNSCSFCIASRIRGLPRSKPIARIKSEIEYLRDQGYREVVLVGLNLGVYGIDCGSSLAELLRELKTVKNLPRLRLSSLEPEAITPLLIGLFNELPLCRHLHIPVQSGSDRVLRTMGRRYTVSKYVDQINFCYKAIPEVALGTDVIVGFPTEDDDAFFKTERLLRDLPFAYFHVFSYSPRPGTPAYELGDPVTWGEKRRRSQILRELGSKKSFEYRQRFLGRVLSGVVEGKNRALTDNYIRVELGNSDHLKPGSLIQVKINKIDGNSAFGEINERG